MISIRDWLPEILPTVRIKAVNAAGEEEVWYVSTNEENGDIILLTKIYSIEPGDLVCFSWNDKSLLKRVIARAGDWVTIDGSGRVYVNGALLDEPYVSEFRLGESDISYPFQVPEDSFFVMGDERTSSLDSRSTLVGCVKSDQIIGEGLIRIRPLSLLKHPET